MRKRILIIPGWLDPDGNSVVGGQLKGLHSLASHGEVFRLNPPRPKTRTPEAALLGLDPDSVDLADGPLIVSALAADPPPKSVHFHLSLMSLVDGKLSLPEHVPSAEERRHLLGLGRRLNTRRLTVLEGDGLDHGLVWEEGSIEMGTTPPAEGLDYGGSLPEGDGETILRRFIDDSINLLDETELNHRRRGEELAPLNCLWPWGQGYRNEVPNLALRRGEPVAVESSSLRLQGLTRLAGYQHGARHTFGKGTSVRLPRLAKLYAQTALIVLDSIQEFRDQGQLEEAAWLTHEIDRELLSPWSAPKVDDPLMVTLLAPGPAGGLGLTFRSDSPMDSGMPFDERLLDDRGLALMDLSDAVNMALTL